MKTIVFKKLKLHIDLDEVCHVLSPVASSVDLLPVLGSFVTLAINTPSRWWPAVLDVKVSESEIHH